MTEHALIFDPELIRRYDRQGPRYTSYPTAVQFGEDFTNAHYRSEALASNRQDSPSPLSLYIHIPFCATVCYYCACNKIITKNQAHAAPYLTALFREIETQGALFDRTRPVEQLHWGGGSPTFLSREQMAELMTRTGQAFRFGHDDAGEHSIEVDPRTTDPDGIGFLRSLGFNRLSLGVQDFDPDVQRAVNRLQSEEDTLAILQAAREAGFHSISVDLIYGLPRQSVASFSRTLDKIIQASPDRISVFNYAHLPHLFKTQRQINEADLPSGEEKLQILGRAIGQLGDAGYVHIGMDHFAKPGDELARAQQEGTLSRNFQGYATRGHCDIIGMGVSSIGRVGASYSQNERLLADYQARAGAEGLAVFRGVRLTAEDELRRAVINQLICHFHLDWSQIETRWDISFGRHFAPELKALAVMQDDGLIEMDARGLRVLPRGRLLIRNVCMVFDAYLQSSAATQPQFSKVI